VRLVGLPQRATARFGWRTLTSKFNGTRDNLVLIVAAGAGLLGFAPVRDLWPLLAVAGGAVALVALAVYFHPIYLAAVAINLVLVVLAWGRLNAAA
jgi:hypothetical protein